MKQPDRNLRKYLAYAIWLILLLIPIFIGLACRTQLSDEAYQYLRTAQNIAAGRGVNFDFIASGNPTSVGAPLFIFVLSLVGRLGGSMDTAAIILSGLGWGILAILFLSVALVEKRTFSAIFSPLCLIINPFVLTQLGTPYSLTIGLLGVLFHLYRKRTFWIGIVVLAVELVAIILNPPMIWPIVYMTALALIGLAVDRMIDKLMAEGRMNWTVSQLGWAVVIVIGLPLSVVAFSFYRQHVQLQSVERLALEARAAEWLQQNSPESAVVVASPRFSYLADRPLLRSDSVLDTASLPSFLNETLLSPPDYFITFQTLDWRYTTQTGWFQERFRVVKRFEVPGYVGSPLTVWQRNHSPFDAEGETPIHVTTQEGLDLVGFQVGPRQIQPGDAVSVQLNWQVTRPLSDTVQTIVRLVSPHDRVAWAQRDMVTPRSLPSDWLETGMIIPETFVLTTTLEIPVGAYLLTTSLHHPLEEGYVPMLQAGDPNPIDRATLGYVVVPWTGEIGDSAVPIHAEFGEQVELLSCVCVEKATPGSDVGLTLYWEALRPPDDNYVVFVHLIDSQGQYVTGLDAPPFGGRYDMVAWLPGNIIPDERLLTLPQELPTGTYSLQVGLYQRESGGRLAAIDSNGVPSPSQTIALPPLLVESQ